MSLSFPSIHGIANLPTSIPSGYGYPLLGVFSFALTNTYCTVLVVKARKKFGVPYPDLYAPNGHKHKKEFDCCQRQHQQFLENLPLMIASTLTVGLQFPTFAGVCSLGWSLCRVVYSYGYSQGDPSKRQLGGRLAHLFDLPLLLSMGYVAYLWI